MNLNKTITIFWIAILSTPMRSVQNADRKLVTKCRLYTADWVQKVELDWIPEGEEGCGGVLGSIFAGYVLLASRSPYPIIVYSVAN